MRTISKILLLAGLFLSTGLYANVLDNGSQVLSIDYSQTNAQSLWKGSSTENYFCNNTGSGASCDTGIGKTTYSTYSLNYGRGLGLGLQADFRLTYATSIIEHGSHPNPTVGGVDTKQSKISEISLKMTKNLISKSSHSTNVYFQYKSPGANSEVANPTFLSVNDFSTHMTLGLTETLSLFENWRWIFDVNYTKRSRADLLESFELPADQINVTLDLPYQLSERISAGMGLVMRHTTNGPDIGGSDWGTINAAAGGIPAFYAIKEQFVGYSMSGSYYFPKSNTWVGASRFTKLTGRNTDQSTTWALFYGLNL
ncbi:MAG: hypothetical protein HN576_03720 [Bacteriovoracaceae bacterium]|jgi:hypothetical protein|nr:hypothetical protein [Bacteriovoracaceae bacterium]